MLEPIWLAYMQSITTIMSDHENTPHRDVTGRPHRNSCHDPQLKPMNYIQLRRATVYLCCACPVGRLEPVPVTVFLRGDSKAYAPNAGSSHNPSRVGQQQLATISVAVALARHSRSTASVYRALTDCSHQLAQQDLGVGASVMHLHARRESCAKCCPHAHFQFHQCL